MTEQQYLYLDFEGRGERMLLAYVWRRTRDAETDAAGTARVTLLAIPTELDGNRNQNKKGAYCAANTGEQKDG
jgi:hypothetical protein